MPAARVQILPELRTAQDGPPVVIGGELRLSLLGAGNTLLTQAPQPASLHFFGRYLTQVRQSTEPFAEFAQLTGRAALNGGKPRFSLRALADFRRLRPSDDGPLIHLRFPTPHFTGAPGGGQRANFLRLPAPPLGGNFFELAVELRLAGQVEAPHTAADILDLVTLPLLQQKQLRVRFLDAQREPIANASCRVRLGEDTTTSSTSGTGELLHLVPNDTEELFVDFERLTVKLVVQRLPPSGDETGARKRLHNLGVADLQELEDGELDTQELALTRFQEQRGLELTGQLDADTAAALGEQNV